MKHYNPSITERANRIFNLKNGDGLSEEIEGPVATIPITPCVNIVKNRNTAGTILATGDKDFYVTHVGVSFSKTAADTGTEISITAFVGGVSYPLVVSCGITLTAERETVFVALPFPVKVDRNTNITTALAGTFTASRFVIGGYFEEVTRT